MPSADRSAAPDHPRRRLTVRTVVLVLFAQAAFLGGLVLLATGGLPGTGDDGLTAITPDRSGAASSRAAAAAGPDTLPQARVNRFDGVAARRLTARQVAYGQRPAGSPQLVRLAGVLRPLLPAGRFEPLPDSTAARPLRNIVGRIPGRRPGIVVGAHYDTLVKPKGFVGANNGAAGTAVVVGVARAMKRVTRPAGAPELTFVLFDAEEPDAGLPEEQADFYKTGLRGSRAYVAAHPGRTRSMLLLDYVGNRGLSLPREASSDRALWQQVRRAAARIGVGSIFPNSTGVTITDDHTPFLRAGVPAVDFIDWSYPGHSLADSMALISRRALDAVGETVVEHLRTAR